MKHFTKLLAAAALLLSSQASFAASFTAADGNTWLTLNDTNYGSYYDVVALCGTAGGTCSGSLSTGPLPGSSIDITGYKFASNADVKNMFSAYAGIPSASVPNPFSNPLGFATFATTNVAFGGLQNSGYLTAFTNHLPIMGFSSDSAANYASFVTFFSGGLTLGQHLQLNAFLTAQTGGAITSGSQLAAIGGVAFANLKAPFLGAYLMKVSEVPVPAALFMFAPALLGFFGLRRKAKVQA